MKKRLLIIITMLIAIFAMSGCKNEQLNLQTYYKMSFEGYSGFAKCSESFDKEALYEAIAAMNKEDKKETCRSFTDNLKYNVSKTDMLFNGETVRVDFTYDKTVAKELGVVFLKDYIEVPVTDLPDTEKINLFEDFSVSLVGASPKLTITYENKSEHEYIKNLEYSVEAKDMLANGDIVKVHCNIDKVEAGKAGYVYEHADITYEIKGVSEYVTDESKIDKSYLKNVAEDAIRTIGAETSSTTGHMLYKATQNLSYLSHTSKEVATGFGVYKVHFLKEKEVEVSKDSAYVYISFEGNISNAQAQEKVYFIFEYKNPSIGNTGAFELVYTEQNKRYKCSTDYQKLYNELILSKEEKYDIIEMNLE